jgi:hypothetical protein
VAADKEGVVIGKDTTTCCTRTRDALRTVGGRRGRACFQQQRVRLLTLRHRSRREAHANPRRRRELARGRTRSRRVVHNLLWCGVGGPRCSRRRRSAHRCAARPEVDGVVSRVVAARRGRPALGDDARRAGDFVQVVEGVDRCWPTRGRRWPSPKAPTTPQRSRRRQ